MLMDDKKQALRRMAIGALAGVAFCLLGVWVLDALPILGSRWNFHNPLGVWRLFFYPSPLRGTANLLLWGAFGAEIALSTLPFADTGKSVVVRSLCHYGVMALTLWGWVVLNFPYEPRPGLVLTFLLPFTLVYVIIWLIRWVGWYSEVAAIREKLGLAPKPSPLKWREVLPYLVLLGAVYGLGLPVLGIFDDRVPVLTGLLLPYLVYPILAGAVGFHTGKHCGFTLLVPLAVYLLSLLNDVWLYLAQKMDIANMDYDYAVLGLVYAAVALALHTLGAGLRRYRKGKEAPLP